MKMEPIVSITELEIDDVWDITFEERDDFYQNEANFIAQNIVVHNSHAAGTVISPIPLERIAPLHITHGDTDYAGKEKTVATQFTMFEVEELGLIKFDILGLSTKTAISLAHDLILERHGVDVDLANLPLDDQTTLDLLKGGKTDGCFQLENTGMKQTLQQIGISSFDDLIVAIAMYRPGPKDYIPMFAKRKHGQERVKYPHPLLEKITSRTFGILSYQEQVMQAFMVLADLTASDGYAFMKGCAKKKQNLIDKFREPFFRGCQKKDIPQDVVNKIWTDMEKFGGYAFNKSLSRDQKIITSEKEYSIQELYNRKHNGEPLPSVYSPTGEPIGIVDVYDHGILPVWEIEFNDGSKHKSTLNHKYMTPRGVLPLHDILKRNLSVIKHRGVGNAAKKRLGLQGLSSSIEEPQGIQCSQKRVRQVSRIQEGLRVSRLRPQRHSQRHGIPQEELHALERDEVSELLEVQSEDFSAVLGRNQSRSRASRRIQREGVGSSIIGGFVKPRRAEATVPTNEPTQYSLSRQFSTEQSSNCNQDFCETGYSAATFGTTEEMERRKPRGVSEEVYSSCHETKEMAVCSRNVSQRGFGSLGFQALSDCQEPNVFVRIEEKTNRFHRQESTSCCGIRWTIPLSAPFERQQDFVREPAEGRRGERFSAKSRLSGDTNIVRLLVGPSQAVQAHKLATTSDPGFILPGKRNRQNDWQEIRIAAVRFVGYEQCYDLEVDSDDHLYCLASGVVNSNSHATSYAYESYKTAYLKAHYPAEFIAARLSVEASRRNFDDVMKYEADAQRNYGMKILPPEINRSKLRYRIVGQNEILRPLIIKGVGDKAAEDIIKHQPYKGKDLLFAFAKKVGPAVNTKVMEALYDAGLFGNDKTKKQFLRGFETIKKDIKKLKGRPGGDFPFE